MSYSSPPYSPPNVAVTDFTGTTSATANVPTSMSSTSLLVRGFIFYNTSSDPITIQDAAGVDIVTVANGSASFAFYFGTALLDLELLFTVSEGTSLSYTVVYW